MVATTSSGKVVAVAYRGSLLRLPELAQGHGRRLVFGAFSTLSTCVSVGIIALAAYWARQPLVFPSLGPTAFLVFDRPRARSAAPRNILLGHLLGAGAGYLSLVVFGLLDARPALGGQITSARVAAIAVSMGLTAGAMVVLGVPHPPAMSTALLLSLGVFTRPEQILFLMLGVVALVVQGMVIDRLVGLDYPLWARSSSGSPQRPATCIDQGARRAR